ncbi:putative rad21/Rec8-like protein [Dioscorea sansibarensis]
MQCYPGETTSLSDKITSQLLSSCKGRNSVETLTIEKNAITTFFGKGRGNQEHSERLEEIVSQSIQKNSHVNQPEIHVEPVNLPETIISESHKDIAISDPDPVKQWRQRAAMSEFNALFSRKGPLGNIWMAAYFFKQLKKKQIASTDISSSIGTYKILPDPEIPYRILTLLLLGAAKIYAKKVEFLYKDCNEALKKTNKAAINRLLMLPDEVTGTSQQKVSEKGKASVSLETTPPLAGAICEPYHGSSIIIPERFELASFDLGIPEDGHIS